MSAKREAMATSQSTPPGDEKNQDIEMRKADDEGGEAEEEAEGEDNGDDSHARNRKRKRNAKANANEDDAVPLGYEPRNKPKRDADGFVAGSVVRVGLSHFVTYDAVELFPGPHLNMIIGPNGTGKSTIVCAIALGLGWKTGVLGRASDAASFVKKGYEDAWIEIELKGKPGRPNTTVKRTLNKRNNASDWFVNGKKVTQKEVTDLVESFNIQINNLCTFLPQEKVADFAKMSPPALLRETERAAGDDRLQAWHDKLIINGKEKVRLEEKLDSDRKETDKLMTQNEALASEVRAFEERKRVEDRLEVLKLERPFAQYNKAKVDHDAAQIERGEKSRILEELKGTNAPMEELKVKQENELREWNKCSEEAATAIKTTVAEQKKRMASIQTLEKKFDDALEDQTQLASQMQKREERIAKLRDTIANAEALIANKPAAVDTSHVDAEAKEVTKQLNRQVQLEKEQGRKKDEQLLEGKSLSNARNEIQRQIVDLDNVKNQRLNQLKQIDAGTYDAVIWLRNNRHLFSGQVFEPILLEINVKDPRHGMALSHTLSFALQKTIVLEKDEDYKIFGREYIDKLRGRVNIAVCRQPLALARQNGGPPAAEEIRKLGFEGYLLDLISGPDLVLSHLCDKAWIHTIPVTANDHAEAQSLEQFQQIRTYIIGNHSHRSEMSRYGSRARFTTTQQMRSGGHGWSRAVNPEQKERLDQSMKQKTQQTAEIEANIADIDKQIAIIRKKKDELNSKKRVLQAERDAQSKSQSDYQRAVTRLVMDRKALAAELNKPSGEERKKQITERLSRCIIKRVELVHVLAEGSRQLESSRASLDAADLEKMRAKAALRRTTAMVSRLAAAIQDAKEDAATAIDNVRICKKRAKELCERAATLHRNASPEVKEAFDALTHEHRSLEEIQEEYDNMQDQLEVARGVNPEVMRIFMKRKEKIADLQANMQGYEDELLKVETTINRIKGKWEPALEAIIADVNKKFSDAFQRFDNAGEVQLNRDADFDKWGIHILVKFRENEALTLLTGQRQSGGERSLSTVMYIISLLGLSVSPFSLVDEINQGMDQRAERKVHDQMIEATCDGKAGQYFLITPKLLSDLRYHPMMKVLVINNGDWIPEKFDARDYVKRKRQALASRN